MTTKKREMIFEAPKASIPASVRELMDAAEKKIREAESAAADTLGAPFEVYFKVTNSKVLYSMKASDAALATYIIKAVREYELVPIGHAAATFPSTSEIGAPMINYDRYVKIDWAKKQINTNFPPDEGDVFLGAMAIVVEDLRKATAGKPAKEGASS